MDEMCEYGHVLLKRHVYVAPWHPGRFELDAATSAADAQRLFQKVQLRTPILVVMTTYEVFHHGHVVANDSAGAQEQSVLSHRHRKALTKYLMGLLVTQFTRYSILLCYCL
jgi:hypothetical protein